MSAKVRAQFHYGEAPERDDWGPDGRGAPAHNWLVRMRYRGRRMTVPFYGGELVTNPTTAEVLECLLIDASGADESFDDWCCNLGYDTDSRKALASYQQVQDQTARLRRFLAGDTYDALQDPETWCKRHTEGNA